MKRLMKTLVFAVILFIFFTIIGFFTDSIHIVKSIPFDAWIAKWHISLSFCIVISLFIGFQMHFTVFLGRTIPAFIIISILYVIFGENSWFNQWIMILEFSSLLIYGSSIMTEKSLFDTYFDKDDTEYRSDSFSPSEERAYLKAEKIKDIKRNLGRGLYYNSLGGEFIRSLLIGFFFIS